MKEPAVALTGIGICSALGSGVSEHYQKLVAGDQSCMNENTQIIPGASCFLGEVDNELLLPAKDDTVYHPAFFSIIRQACSQIVDQVEALKEKYGANRIGVVLGSSTSGIHAGEAAHIYTRKNGQFPSEFHYFQQEMGAASLFVKDLFGLQGIAYTISTACTSGAKALIAARRLIRQGSCDAVITGGADSLCRLTIRGFHSLGLVSPSISNPFSVNRAGLNLGEGACLFTMERADSGIVLTGAGESSDAYHMSAPHPEGIGAAYAIEKCLADAKRLPEDVGYINLHGTGTLHNDRAEAIAIASVFGSSVRCSSTKTFVGHLLGAAGAFEAGIAFILLSNPSRRTLLPPHIWDGRYDPELPEIIFSSAGDELLKPIILSTSFAFGGSNSALLFERVDNES